MKSLCARIIFAHIDKHICKAMFLLSQIIKAYVANYMVFNIAFKIKPENYK